MTRLDEATLERVLPLVRPGLDKYCWLQTSLPRTDVAHDRAFQKRFNGFYRVRRGAVWQSAFYTLLEQQKSQPQSFTRVLRALYAATGRIEASFASKLAATVDPDQPVIDAFVLTNLGLRLPHVRSLEERLEGIDVLRLRVARIFADYLSSEMGRYLVTRFEEFYPDRHLTKVKMLDLILWQSR
jgi:hypothetical protein